MTSAIATAVDYALYMALVTWFFGPVVSNIISYTIAVVINFTLQKKYIFDLQRRVRTAFILSVLVSLGGLLLSTGIIYFLTRDSFFMENQIITKLIATGLVFFYNFYLKRFVFEKKFI
ncbi:MAG: GtrA family protein [Saprospiraceae bacterium]